MSTAKVYLEPSEVALSIDTIKACASQSTASRDSSFLCCVICRVVLSNIPVAPSLHRSHQELLLCTAAATVTMCVPTAFEKQVIIKGHSCSRELKEAWNRFWSVQGNFDSIAGFVHLRYSVQSLHPAQNFWVFSIYSRILADFLSHSGKWVGLIKFEAEY